MSGYNQYQGNDYSGSQGSAQSYYNDSNAEQYQQYQQSQGYQQQQQGYGQQPPPYGQNQGYSGQGQGESDGPSGDRGFLGAVVGGGAGAFGGAKFGGKATGHTKASGLVGAIAGAITGSKLQDATEDWRDDRHEKKEEEKRREEEERRRRDDDNRRHEDRYEDRHDSNSGSGGGGHYAGAFSGSSDDIRLDENNGRWTLRASCRRGDGSSQSSTISLNDILSNDDGSFQWGPSSGGGGGGSQRVTVQQGDTLRAIAAKFNTSFEVIARQNGIANPDLIYPGQQLEIPGGGGGGYSSGGGNFGSSARNVRLVDGGRKLEAELRRGDGKWNYTFVMLDERISNSNGTLRFV